MTRFQKILLAVIALFLLASMFGIIFYVNKSNLSSQENVLFNVLLALFSAFVSLIISHYYFDSSRQSSIEDIKNTYQDNFTLYAKKAAEKVDNLSSELTKLSLYLQQDEDLEQTPEIALLIKEEKIRSAIHIIQTLKSINDKSLSDWRGVVPEDTIEERNEIRIEQETGFQDLIDSYSKFLKQPVDVTINKTTSTSSQDLTEINKKIDRLATSIIGTPLKNSEVIKKEKIARSCPQCGHQITYRQRPAATSIRGMKCMHCGSKLSSSWDKINGFTLISAELATKKTDAIREAQIMPSEEVIELVCKELPAQPWPKGIANELASKLGISHAQMQRTIKILIERGEFKKQINGVLYEPEELESIKNTGSKTKAMKEKPIKLANTKS